MKRNHKILVGIVVLIVLGLIGYIWYKETIQEDQGNNDSDNKDGYDVYILMGQSNMVGRGYIKKGIDDDYSLIDDKVFQFPYDENDTAKHNKISKITGNVIKKATNQLDFISDVHGASTGEKSKRTGLWKTFVETIIQKTNPKRKILLVPVAKGGSGFDYGNWNPGDFIYTAAIHSINKAMSTHPNNTLKAILWHQGESDSGTSSARSAYRRRFTNFYNHLLLDIP